MAFLTNMALQKRISLLVLAGLAIGLGLFSWLGVQSLNESTSRILSQRLTIARIMASHLDGMLTQVLSHLQSTARSYGRLLTREEFVPLAGSLRQIFDEAGIAAPNIALIDRNGKVLLVEPDDAGMLGTDMYLYPEVKRALESGQPTVSNLIVDQLAASPIVLATMPILNGKGEVIGALASSIDIERSGISSFSQVVQIGNTGYTEIVDGNGIVLARTEPGSRPTRSEKSDHPGRFAELIKEGKATVGTCHRCHETNQELQRRRDVLAFAPLSVAPWGVAIRQSEEEALAPTRQLESRLLLLGIIVLGVAFLLAWLMIQGVVRPVKMLTAAAKKVAAGDFRSGIPLRRKDEIGELSTAFHTMTQELAKSRDELVSRNDELSILNSIAATVSQSLNLKDVLENALQNVLEFTGAKTGCVFLRDAGSNKLELMRYSGLSSAFSCPESGSPSARCSCHQVLSSGQTLMVNDVSQCPMLGNDIMLKDDIDYFVSVPLKSKNRTLGIINIAGSGGRDFTENDFKLLDSIGYHVGLAIENSVLYNEAKEKERLKGQLLSSVISAQEEERKRVARELHDEYGQMLTGLMMTIESLENVAPSAPLSVAEKLKNAKLLVGRALKDIRRLTLDLRPSTLDHLGLVTTVRSYARTHLEDIGISVDFKSKGFRKRLAPEIDTALFRIIQEAIHNITKYAEAHNVSIQLETNRDTITATIEDDGKGFDMEAVLKARPESHSLGLLGMEERVTLLGGTFSINSQIGRGTRLTVVIPVDQQGKSSILQSEPEESKVD